MEPQAATGLQIKGKGLNPSSAIASVMTSKSVSDDEEMGSEHGYTVSDIPDDDDFQGVTSLDEDKEEEEEEEEPSSSPSCCCFFPLLSFFFLSLSSTSSGKLPFEDEEEGVRRTEGGTRTFHFEGSFKTVASVEKRMSLANNGSTEAKLSTTTK